MKIAVGTSRYDTHWVNQEWTWPTLVERLSQTKRTGETLSEFLALDRRRQDDIKDVGGFVGGELSDGHRKRVNVVDRCLLTLDLDFASTSFWDDFALLHDFACVLYSTHKHSPATPRLRLVAPLSRTVSPQEYLAISRRVSDWIGIDQVDDTTHEVSRLFYWPSTSSDGEYVFEHQDGPVLDVDEVLATYADWRDVTSYPRSSREGHLVGERGDKQADPTTKDGIVGAFCRVHTISSALEHYLSEVYVPAGVEDRYSLVGGESASGLVVYDGDLFAYSHHATDPAGGQLVNAFDLVRLHRFGHLDDDAKPETATSSLPSFKAMCELASADEQVLDLIDRERREAVEHEFEPIPDDIVLDTSWEKKLSRDRQGNIRDTLPNVVTILERDQRLEGIIYDELAGAFDIVDGPLLPWRRLRAQGWTEADFASLQVYVAQTYGVHATGRLADALLAVTTQHRRHHPIKAWLESLPAWDGTERLDTLLIDHLGAEDNPYTRAVARKLVVAMVARTFRPGTKFDHVLVLQGPQGIGKSVFCSRLGGKWFTDSLALGDMRDKSGAEKVQGVWLAELSEMSGMRKTEVEVVKSFITRTEDHYRAAYARNVEARPRTAVFIGTTNDADGFLRDVTGNRRFWPVVVTGDCPRRPWDLEGEYLEQVFAEAMHAFANDEPLFLAGEAAEAAKLAQAEAMEADDREGVVAAFLDTPLPAGWDEMSTFERRQHLGSASDFGTGDAEGEQRTVVSNIEIWAECFGQPPSSMTKRDSYDIAALMKRIPGWRRSDRRLIRNPYGEQRCYERSER